MSAKSGLGGLPSWALLVGIGGGALVMLEKGLIDSSYTIFGTGVQTVNAAGGVIGIGLAVVTLAMILWAVRQV